jgi:hypothetical protein
MILRKKTQRKLLGISGAVALTLGLVLGQGLTSPASAAELVQDGGFEAATGSPLNSPNWTEADSLFGSPLCNNAECGTGAGASPPRTGLVWAWFGGAPTAGQTGSLSQAVTFPTGGAASLTYWYRNGSVATPFDATLTVKIDSTTVKTHTEAAVAESAYSQQTIDVSSFADGASHTLSFNYLNGGTGTNSMVVDDVSIQTTPPADTTPPQTTISSPANNSISKSLTLPIAFTSSESPSTFSCQVDATAAAACTSPKSITVTPGVHTFKVAATDAALNTDATPATVTFTAYDCPTLNAAVAAAQAKADAANKKVSKAKKALKKAKKSGNASKIKKAKKKLKKAKAAAKAANAALASAKAAAAPCGTTPKVTSDKSALKK